MNIHNHCLTRDDGQAARHAASPHAGDVIVQRFLVIHYSPLSRRTLTAKSPSPPTKTTCPTPRHPAGTLHGSANRIHAGHSKANISRLSAPEFASACLPIQTGKRP
jgi:hypothetical protein